jgi:ABC-type phosphate transport system substrate-binding protein
MVTFPASLDILCIDAKLEKSLKRSINALSLVGLAAIALVSPAIAQESVVAVVVNSSNAITSMAVGELRKVFAGEKRTWPGGRPIQVIVRTAGSHERLVLMKLLSMSEQEYRQYWAALVFRGYVASEPVAVFSNGMEKEAVVAIPGAIALMDTRDVKPGLKIIKIDGLLPGASGYPLH